CARHKEGFSYGRGGFDSW
nr:immunoglobulin heavy chain junction region [Macaca mulatta]MOW19052.1 immunoglobulin heavy chain junction region [Macaca mulatta]MOW19192.1 immunoglobulin heavy chain junction region [Macaca mulatta]MOW19339.1 immunoglobulin heavy chain junction region [Macaca mulatta]MOW19813.1 immunoglobulin heavy chain junction region [Macaca mulatta]